MSATRRLFFGLQVPASIGEAMLHAVPRHLGVRPVAAVDDLHLTLKFLGNTAVPLDRILAAADGAARSVSEEGAPIPTLESSGVGFFPNGASTEGRIFWADLAGGEAGERARRWLARIAERMDSALDSVLSVPIGRREAFVPHITLARRGDWPVSMTEAANWVDRWRGVSFGSWVPASIRLYETAGAREGTARFRVLSEFPFS